MPFLNNWSPFTKVGAADPERGLLFCPFRAFWLSKGSAVANTVKRESRRSVEPAKVTEVTQKRSLDALDSSDKLNQSHGL